jgi:hypothetical protein
MKKKSNNSKSKFADGARNVRLSPRQLRRDCIDSKTRLALILNCLCGYNQSEAYAIAFNFKGSYKSLAPLASRFFNSPDVRESAELFYRYYCGVEYHVNDKYFKY